MIHLLILAVHLLSTIAKLARPGGVHAVVAESLMLKHQLLISSRPRRRAPAPLAAENKTCKELLKRRQ